MKINLNDSNIFKKVMLLFTVLISTVLYSQTYPVQVTPQLIPPYSLKISDYATTSSEKLYANILLTDVNEVGRRIRLKMYIEGQGLSITTQDVIAGETPIYLDGGINLRLSNLDLQAYFQLNNLVGITPGQYNAPLPNGGYDFCFEVYDYFTNRKLSNKSCTTVYLLQNDPPILNLPFKDNIVNATNPQNVLFTWTPRHSNTSNVQYEFTLKELWDVQNPQANFLASVPFYQTNTYSTTLLVGPEAPQLLSGKIYGWQVRAFVSDGVNETSVFKNDGKSEIFWFKYLEDCKPPSFVISQALTAESVQVNWQSSEHLRYRIQYRKKGFGDDDWFEVNSYTNEGKIRNLEAATIYEFRVGGECTQLSGFAYSNIQEFTTPSNDEAAYYNCGLKPQVNITNKEPLPKLGINETFTAGDFPVITREVTGSNGTFSGWGYITLPFLENLKEIIDAANIATGGEVNIGKYTRIKVVFDNVQINSSYELTDGVVVTDYDPEWGGIIDADEVINDIVGDNGAIQGFDATNTDIKEVTVNESGNIIIIPEVGEPIPIEVQKPVTITDKNGDQWTVHEDGKVTEGKAAEGGAPSADNTEGISSAGKVKQISSKDVRVTFTPSGYYGTDTYQDHIKSDKYKSEYEFIKTHDNKDYSVLYKLLSDLPEHKTDIIKATVNFSNGKTKDDIVFKTKEGTAINPTWSGNEATLPLQRKFEFAKEEILATVKPKDSTGKFAVAGKLNVWHAQQQTINLTLVSVDGASVSNVGDRINEIYNKAGIHFNIKTESINLGLGSLDVGDSDMLSNYTDDEKKVISAFKDGKTIAKDQYYMFFLDDKKVTLSKGLNGFMPLKRQFGFVFTQQDAGRISAHELGHGIFGLKHPFDQYNDSNSEAKTDYLMDYGSGTRFSHMDWQKLHAPGIQLYWFQGDEAGEFAYSHLTPNWEPFSYKESNRYLAPNEVASPNGAVFGIVKDDVQYKWNGSDYVNGTKKLNISKKTNPSEGLKIQLYWNRGKCGYNEYYYTTWGYIKDKKGKLNVDNVTDGGVTSGGKISCFKNGINEGKYRNENLCMSKDLSVLNNQRIEIEKICENIDSAEVIGIVEKVNSLDICALRKLSYSNVEILLKRLVKENNFNNDLEKAIVKLMNSISEDNSIKFYDNVLVVEENKTLDHLLDKMTNVKFYFFGDNNYNFFVETLAFITSKVKEDKKKWNVVNRIIIKRYGDLLDSDVLAFDTIIGSISEYKEIKHKVTPTALIFKEMLIDDCKRLLDFKVVFDLALNRFDNKETFSSFTQANKVKVRIPGLVFDTTCSINDSGVGRKWSWVLPGKFDVTCSNGDVKQFRYTDETVIAGIKQNRINDVFVWGKYYWENKETMDDLFSNNLVEYLRIFKEQLDIHFKNIETQNKNFWEDTKIVCENLKDIFNQINVNETSASLKELNKDKKVSILKKYFECSNDVAAISFDKVDTTILKLITSFEKTDSSILLALEKIGIQKIYDKLNDDENFATLAKTFVWMGGQIQNTGHYEELTSEDILNSEKEVKDYSNLLGLESDMLQFKNFSSEINNDGTFTVGNKKYKYNKMVLVYAAGDFEFLGQKFKEGDVLTMPFIQAFAMHKSNRNIVTEKSAWTAVDVVLMGVGYGEIKILFTAGNYVRKAFVIGDFVGTSAGVLANVVNESALSPKARYNLQMLAILASLPQVATSIRKVDELVTVIDGEVNALSNLKHKEELKSYLSSIKSRIIKIDLSFKEFGYADDIITKLKNKVKELKLNNSDLNLLLNDIKNSEQFKTLLNSYPESGLDAWNVLKKNGRVICN
ncbi:fibronectin type III domain-containing protein [Tenacibaculum singaporense]|uniref:fibronectin type III domain-containing protein n=1 Tax=Tenacibaculum singaporense TaxID=2358479 RepID=UPI003519CBB6